MLAYSCKAPSLFLATTSKSEPRRLTRTQTEHIEQNYFSTRIEPQKQAQAKRRLRGWSPLLNVIQAAASPPAPKLAAASAPPAGFKRMEIVEATLVVLIDITFS